MHLSSGDDKVTEAHDLFVLLLLSLANTIRRVRRADDDVMYRNMCAVDTECVVKSKPNLRRKCSKFGFCHEDRG